MNITLEHASTGSTVKTKIVLTVKQDDKVLAINEVNLAKEKERREFIDSLIDEHPGLGADDVRSDLERKLKEITAELLQEPKELAQTVQDEPLAKSKALLNETDSDLVEQANKLLLSPYLVEKVIDHAHGLGWQERMNSWWPYISSVLPDFSRSH